MRKVIFNLINEHRGNWTNVYDSILHKEKPTINVTGDEYNYIFDNSLFITDDDYSDKFKKMYMPPFALFYYGNIDLINSKVLSILGKLELEDISKLQAIKESNQAICLYEPENDQEVINELIKQDFKLVLLTNKKIDYSQKLEKENNIVYITEFCTDKVDYDEKLVIKRLMYAVGDTIFLKDKTIENIEIIITNYKNEQKKCLILDGKLEEMSDDFTNVKIFSHINRIEEIIDFCKS